MGSLPSFSDAYSHFKEINTTQLMNLFKTQQKYLNFFFHNLDLNQTLIFTQTLLKIEGTIFFTGVGKSGFVAQKISQTLVSLGIRASFLSPVDALHGDIGILSGGTSNAVVFFSKSGNSEELLKLAPCAKAKGAYLISVTSTEDNLLRAVCDLNVHLPLERELCPFDLAPVTSTTIQMVFGDTVAVALMGARNLTRDEYAANHRRAGSERV
ncbi:putative arabinose 5-phosphate isomerase [Vitis vinifera]|uniref:Putative arabinose 5-phosphate isomerase n=1 Tax=Vitis vinifera TaxID=29760 RepID=A0A438KE41_VITVI|nr:putative arabinose 5-phosphate isomerase [Vitis vinifera]